MRPAPAAEATPAAGLVTFRLGGRDYATPLPVVREVVRLQGLSQLPGTRPPLLGVLELRGTALPVLDLRQAVDGRQPTGGDVLVLDLETASGLGPAEGPVGVAVDEVRAVVATDDLPATGTGAGGLPGYVLAVLRAESGVVLLVDLPRMVRAAADAG